MRKIAKRQENVFTYIAKGTKTQMIKFFQSLLAAVQVYWGTKFQKSIETET